MIFSVVSGNVNAQIRISGSLSGTLEDTTYIVEDSVYIIEGRTLEIEAGATLLFNDGMKFIISGRLIANGTEQDSILFILNEGAEAWGGLDFWLHASQFSEMEYCRVSGSNSSGMYCMSYGCPNPLRHCVISDNSAEYNNGGGIHWEFLFPRTIENCIISNNTNTGIVSIGLLTLDRCTIINNSGGGIRVEDNELTVNGCLVQDNSNQSAGGGILCDGFGSIEVVNTVIKGNFASESGGGVFSMGYNLYFSRCIIINNRTDANGGGLFSDGSQTSIMNCTIAENYAEGRGSGIFSGGSPIISNNTISYNHGGSGIYFYFDLDSPTFNSFFGNDGGDFMGDYPDSLGILSQLNPNGDSCDFCYNIFEMPQFMDVENLDFTLLESSPLIDAGDPGSPLDPDSTIADIGAYYFSQLDYIDHLLHRSKPLDFEITHIYPNPFNSTTKIEVCIPYPANLEICVYNIMGKLICELANGNYPYGYKDFVFDGYGLASGTYLLQVKMSGNVFYSRKLVLLR